VVAVSRHRYAVRAYRSGDWWAIEIPEVRGIFSQARRLDGVEFMARDAIAVNFEVAPDSFDVEIRPDLGDADLDRLMRVVRDERARAAEAAERAAAGTEVAVRRLSERGYPIRDIGALLGISFQRVAQLTDRSRRHAIAEHAARYDTVDADDLPPLTVLRRGD
jgi:hypothetical protein